MEARQTQMSRQAALAIALAAFILSGFEIAIEGSDGVRLVRICSSAGVRFIPMETEGEENPDDTPPSPASACHVICQMDRRKGTPHYR